MNIKYQAYPQKGVYALKSEGYAQNPGGFPARFRAAIHGWDVPDFRFNSSITEITNSFDPASPLAIP